MGTPANLEALARAAASTATATPADVVIAVDGPATARSTRAERELRRSAARRATAPRRRRRARCGAAARRARRRQRGADLGARRVRGARGAPRADRRAARVPVLRPRLASTTRSRSSAAAPSCGLLVMGPGCGTAMLGGVGLGFANVVRAGSGRDRRRGRHRRAGGGVLLDRRASACRRSSASAGATCRPTSAALMFRRGDASCSPPTTATDTLLLVSKPPDRDGRRSALGDVDVRRQARGRRVRRLGRRRRAVRGPPDARGRRVRRGGRRRRRAPTLEPPRGRAAAAARPVLRRLAGARGRTTELARPIGGNVGGGDGPSLRPRRGGVHAGPPAPDGRPRACGSAMLRDAAATTSAASCSTSCSGTAPTPTRPAGSPPRCAALAERRPVIAHVCGTRRRSAGRAPPGGRRCATPA